MPDLRLLRIEEVATMFEVRPSTIRDWIHGKRKDGLIMHAEKLPTGWARGSIAWYITPEEVQRFANALYGAKDEH